MKVDRSHPMANVLHESGESRKASGDAFGQSRTFSRKSHVLRCGSPKKGQLMFEFVIAALVFFSIIFFVLNYLSSAVHSYDTDFFREDMESKASQISELMVMGKGVWSKGEPLVLGLAQDWPTMNSTKIMWLREYCRYPANYTRLVNSLGVHPRNMVKIQVNGTRADGSQYELANCSIREPTGAKVESKRLALNESGGAITVSVKIW